MSYTAPRQYRRRVTGGDRAASRNHVAAATAPLVPLASLPLPRPHHPTLHVASTRPGVSTIFWIPFCHAPRDAHLHVVLYNGEKTSCNRPGSYSFCLAQRGSWRCDSGRPRRVLTWHERTTIAYIGIRTDQGQAVVLGNVHSSSAVVRNSHMHRNIALNQSRQL